MLLKVKKTIYNILIYYKVIYSCDGKAKFSVSNILLTPNFWMVMFYFFPYRFPQKSPEM